MGHLNVLGFAIFVLSAVWIEATDPVDVILLLDSSDGVRSANFAEEKTFAKTLAQRLWDNGNRIGLYTFGSSTHPQFSLNTYHQESDVVTAIRYMWYSTGNGDLEKALDFTLGDAFTTDSGERECVPNILIVLTHSGLANSTLVTGIKEKIKQHAVSIIIIDMVTGAYDKRFQGVTGNTSRILDCPNYQALQTLPSTIVNQVKSESLPTGCGVLSAWEAWSRCSVSCGNGLRFRIRRCKKTNEADKDCYGERSEDTDCFAGKQCTDPVDGMWSDWGTWVKCSQSCNNGTQQRQRLCDQPFPAFGGKSCPGSNTQTRRCALWKCPDCNKRCPSGGHLDSNCSLCVCSSVALFGRVRDNIKAVVEDAEIYLDSRPYDPIGFTNYLGFFNVSNVCMMNEKILIVKGGYESVSITPTEVNSTHWTINGTLIKTVAPMFTTNPVDKVRMTGQSVSLCCSANGFPVPTEYKWFKDDIEMESKGTNGTLTLAAVTLNDAGVYKCTAETTAGVSQSDEAVLTVKDQTASSSDTCGQPISNLETLPPTCFLTGDVTKNSTLDVKTCGGGKCISTALIDNGTCSEWWPNHCCDVDTTDPVDITCDGFSYKTTIVKSCKCRLCMSKTTISGRAFGRTNGTDEPLQLGSVSLNGVFKTRTTMTGYFRFDVRDDIKRAIITFTDELFNKLSDHIKIVNIEEGVDTQLSVIIPHKPIPVAFNPSIGTDLPLGTDKSNTIPTGSISVPEDALVTEDGEPFQGHAKVSVQYTDPRSLEDLEKASGEFVYNTPNGDKLPLRTYGMFQGMFTDDKGNGLICNKPLSVSLDSSLFNISQNKDGDADVSLWHFDQNKGVWVEQGSMQFSNAGSGRRKLLANKITGSFRPPNVLSMDPYSYSYHTERVPHTKTTWSWKWTGNKDHRVYRYVPTTTTYYTSRQVRDSKLKTGICWVSVSVYKDFTLRQTVEPGSVTVTAYSQEIPAISQTTTPEYLGIENRPVGRDGHVCLMVFCDKLVYIYANKKDGTRLSPAKHTLPDIYPVYDTPPSDRLVKFESRDFNTAIDCPAGQVCKGPMYVYPERAKCTNNARTDGSYRFNFAPFTKEPSISLTVGSKNNYDAMLSWYPVSPAKKTFRSCFMKVQIKVANTFDIRLITKSHLGSRNGSEFGTYDVGPVPNPKSTDLSNRGACVEFRCPGYIKNGTKEIYDQPTVLTGRFVTTNRTLNCKASFKKGLNITPDRDRKGFTFVAEPGRNYGYSVGVFVNDNEASKVQDFCYSGIDQGPKIDGIMDPDKNPAMTFDCLT